MAEHDWIYRLQQAGPMPSTLKIQANPQWASTVTNRVEPYKSLPDKLRPALEAVAEYFRNEAIPKTFSSEGPGWRQLALRTRRERQDAGFPPQHPILRRTDDLYKELTDKAHANHVEIIKTGPNARLILGGSSQKYVRNTLGESTIGIPSRPMIPGTGWKHLDTVDDTIIRQILTEKILEIMTENRGR